MPQRIDLGRALLAVGAALLFVSLFLEWFGGTGATGAFTGWQVFESLDLVLTALALTALVTAWQPGLVRLPVWAVPAAALVIVAVQLINPPPLANAVSDSREIGAWLALGGAALMTIAAGMSLSAISISVSVSERDLRPRVPAVDRRRPAATAPPDEDDAPPPPTSLFDRTREEPARDDRTQPFGVVRPEDDPPRDPEEKA